MLCVLDRRCRLAGSYISGAQPEGGLWTQASTYFHLCLMRLGTQWAFGAKMTSYRRRCDVMHRRYYDVFFTSCARLVHFQEKQLCIFERPNTLLKQTFSVLNIKLHLCSSDGVHSNMKKTNICPLCSYNKRTTFVTSSLLLIGKPFLKESPLKGNNLHFKEEHAFL